MPVSNPGPIRRLVQLILDKKAAKDTEQAAKQALGGVETQASRLESLFKRLGGILAAAFGVRAIINFGKESIKAAAESERIWSDLKGTIDATGESFEAMEGDLRSLSQAFQEATIHTDEDYAQSLGRLISLTGDVAASTNNMGLVANVAARFFNGELAPATDLVAKVMNGMTTQLQRMGIHVTSAQEGLEVLAQRSMGAAEERAATFSGRLTQLNNLWDEFKETLGGAVVGSDQATSALDFLRGVILALTQAAAENKEEIRTGFFAVVKATIVVIDAAYRAIRGLGELLVGPFMVGLGAVAFAWGKLVQVTALATQAVAGFFDLIGLDSASKSMAAFTKELDAQAKSFTAWGKAAAETGIETVVAGAKRFAEPTFDFDNLPGSGPRRRLGQNKPMKGSHAKPEDTPDGKKVKTAEDALKSFEATMRGVAAMSSILGERYDALGAEAQALTTLIQNLAELGMKPSDPIMAKYAERLKEVERAAGETKALQTLEKQLTQIDDLAPLLGKGFDDMGARAAALESALKALSDAGLTPADEAMRDVATRLGNIRQEMAGRNAVKEFEDSMREAAGATSLLGNNFDEFGRQLDPATVAIKSMQEEGRALMRVIQELRDAGFADSDPILARYLERLADVQEGLRQVAKEAKVAEEAAALVGEVVGAVLTGGLGPFAAMKARQNLIEAAEEVVRGISAALNPFTAVSAGAHFALAARHVAIAAAWGALAKGVGGGGGSVGGGGGVGSARGAAGAASQTAKQPNQEVHIHLEGPGFDALNPRVQKVLEGARRQVAERFGSNAEVILHTGGTPSKGSK